MTTRTITIRIGATPGSRFAPNAFDRQLDAIIKIIAGGETIEGKCTAVEVVDDGTAAVLDLEVPE